MATHLPIYDQPKGSLREDGSRRFIYPADVQGRFQRLRYVVFAVLVAIYVVTPFVRIDGHPAIFLDIPARRFYLFGGTFNAQDFWLVFFLLTGVGFVLFVVTTLLGRIWCGYACPQTVFLEGVYRRIERWIEGKAQDRIRRNNGPTNFAKVWRKVVKHGLYLGFSLFLAHVFLSYFVSLPSLWTMVRSNPGAHPEAFAWVMGISVATYANFAWFREQVCLILCPYGRLQSLLTDNDTLVLGYDTGRGEPRGKKSDPSAGDCVDCRRCVAVCPTGIDIREGLQIECIGCAACIDACDDIMDKLGRDRGLIRYDSLRGLEEGDEKRIALYKRPRMWLYAAIGVVLVVVAGFAFRSRTAYEANILRLQGPPFVVQDGVVRNSFRVHLVNKEDEDGVFQVQPGDGSGLSYVIPREELTVGGLKDEYVPVFVTTPKAAYRPGQKIHLTVRMLGENEAHGGQSAEQARGARRSRELAAPFLGPER